ncbi:MAG: diguanylate cyclase [Pseudomonadota bacterium]
MAKILIVDDSELIINLASNILAGAGHKVFYAETGYQALQKVSIEKPDLILLDIVLPGIDGFEVCKQLTGVKGTDDIPIIMLTSRTKATDKIKGLNSGAVDYITKPFDPQELIARVNTQLRVRELHETLNEKNRLLQELVNKDGLTNLYNHRYLQDQLIREIDRADRYENHLVLLMIDIDKFKEFNDNHGHQAGDIILKSLAKILNNAVRESDTPARYGGEEFAIILVHADFKAALEIAERLRKTVESYDFIVDNNRFQITISIGMACYARGTIDKAKDLVAASDKALYMAKGNGRNRVETYCKTQIQ